MKRIFLFVWFFVTTNVMPVSGQTPAIVLGTLTQNGAPVPNAIVSLGRSISGQTTRFDWQKTTDANGQFRFDIQAGSALYVVRATDAATGKLLDTWGSIPLNPGRVNVLSLPIGEAATISPSDRNWFGQIRPPVARDTNPDPNIVEVTLTAREAEVGFEQGGQGNKTRVWTFNGHIPGPTIEGQVGNTLIVHFYNKLPEATTIHWHGLELPAQMDGSLISQNPINAI